MFEKHVMFKAYFGRDIKGISTVTVKDFRHFLKIEVDSKIAGYTITKGRGVWEGTHEGVFILEVMVDDNKQNQALVGHQLTRIIEAYNREFDQECVMVTKQDIEAVFIG